jgi:hypothetical protein
LESFCALSYSSSRWASSALAMARRAWRSSSLSRAMTSPVRTSEPFSAGTSTTLPRVSARSSTCRLATVCPRSTISTTRGSAVCWRTRTRASGWGASCAVSEVAPAGVTGSSRMIWPETSQAATAMAMPEAMR